MKLSNHKPWFPSEWPMISPHKSTILFIAFIFITTYKYRCLHKREGCINKPTDARTDCSYPPGNIITDSTIGSLKKDIAVKEMPHQIRQEEQSMRQTSLPSIQIRTIDVDEQDCCHYCNDWSPG